MPLRDIFTSRSPLHSLRVSSGRESFVTELARELKELRKVSLNLLIAFHTVYAISPHSICGTITLALLLYTINLHITISAGFLWENPTLSRLLHTIPLLGILCMTIFQLIIVVHSPAVAAAVLFVCALPPLAIFGHLTRRYIETILPFPVQLREVVADALVSTSIAAILDDR